MLFSVRYDVVNRLFSKYRNNRIYDVQLSIEIIWMFVSVVSKNVGTAITISFLTIKKNRLNKTIIFFGCTAKL